MYCLVDEKHVVHNAAKGVPRNVVIDGERMSVKNIELYKRVLEAEKKEDGSDRRHLQANQQPGLQYQHKGANQDTCDLHGQQEMDLGRQCAYTGIRAL